ncbi:MAG: UDP-3-O-acyl-N-acetylglucosamine deacetylase, partial [Alphaproteobacteria bacterium]
MPLPVVPGPRTLFSRRLRGVAGLRGIGLISGHRVGVRIRPGSPGDGITFVRVDRHERGAMAPADWRRWVEAPKCTCLEAKSGARFMMVEHCLAALSAARLMDVVVEVDGPELPHLDGSAQPYCDMILEAGTELAPQGRVIKILQPLEFNFDRSHYRFEPADRLELDVSIALNHIGRLEWAGPVEWRDFQQHIAPARSFTR